jgi:hypothetical protein
VNWEVSGACPVENQMNCKFAQGYWLPFDHEDTDLDISLTLASEEMHPVPAKVKTF